MTDVTVSEAVAEYFFQQCIGEHGGPSGPIEHNPPIQSLLSAHGVYVNRHNFARFLRQCADHLEKRPPF